MKFCPNCGQGNEDQAIFCESCGAKLEAESAPTTGPYQAPPGMPPAYPYSRKETENGAVASLVLGIAAFFVCPLVLGILAVIFGKNSLDRIRESGGILEGESMARAGLILGWINIALSILGIIIVIIVFSVVASRSAISLLPVLILA